MSDLNSWLFANLGDGDLYSAFSPVVKGTYAASASAATGFGPASSLSNSGKGLYSRALTASALFPTFEALNTVIKATSGAVDASIIDLVTFAAWYNSTPYTVLFSPATAAAYYLAYSQGRQLAPGIVFATAGIALGSYVVGTGFTAGAVYPTANGTAGQGSPSTDANGLPVYAGGMPMPQGFAPIKQVRARVTTDINGTCAITVTAKNQAGVDKTWTATLDNLTAGATVNLSRGTAAVGDRMNSRASLIAFTGAATVGALVIETVAER
jgi:hypothetical protein